MTRTNILKKIILTTMIVTMPLMTSNAIYAQNNNTESLNVEYVDSFDGMMEKSLNEISADKLITKNTILENEIPNLEVSNKECIGELLSEKISLYSSENSITQKFSDTITEDGGLRYLLITLAPDEILQASLEGPNNAEINYDLLLYTYNDGLETNVSNSTLTTYINKYKDGTMKSVEDGISYINKGESTQTYALVVYATQGCSSVETFSLTVSIDEKGYYDSSEPNDSPFTAKSISTGVKITGCNLNVSNDQDWFVWNVPSTVNGVSLMLSNSSYKADMYYASGKSMVLVNPSNGIYNLNSGYYYVRVYNANSEFVSSDYTLTLQPYGNTAANINVTFNGDMGNSKIKYSEGYYYRFQNTLTPSIMLLDSSGYPVRSKNVTLTWLSGTWKDETGNSTRIQTVTTDSSGKASFDLTVPIALGYNSYILSGPKTFIHYYDVDGIVFTCGNVSNSQIVYHYRYSDYIGG